MYGNPCRAMARRTRVEEVARSLEIAQHEAAHLVVGRALGLRPFRAVLGDQGDGSAGFVEWDRRPWYPEAVRMMYAAGVVWERKCGDLTKAEYDLAELRRAGVQGNGRLVALERAAWAILAERHALHAKITRALYERDLTERDIRALAKGQFPRDYDAA